MVNDFFSLLYWWLLLLLGGGLVFPWVSQFFSSFWDRGWLFSKIWWLVVLSYLVFLAGRIHLFPFFQETVILFLLVFVLGGVLFWREKKRRNQLYRLWREKGEILVIEEGLFFFSLAGWSFIRGLAPRIEGLEKFMDFGFVNSLLRSRWFPPQDMWFAGEKINYYYFGHLQAAVLTKLSGLESGLTYNLMIATLFALSLVGGFSLVATFLSSFKKRGKKVKKMIILGGLISAFLLTLGGNLHPAVYLLKDGPKKYWYPDATRFIGYRPNNPHDKTIHEFPSYSFVVADLHGHLNDLPTALLFVAVLWLFFSSPLKERRKKWPLLSFLLAVMYMTNSWDFLVYGGLYAFLGGVIVLSSSRNKKKGIVEWFKEGVMVLLGAAVFSLPFSLSFKPLTQGIGLVHARSLFWQLLILWGFFWFVALSFFLVLRKKVFSSFFTDLFVLGIFLWATILIVIPEIIYFKDIYIPEYHRANTMFKLTYQAFVLYSLGSGYVFFRLREELKVKVKRYSFTFLFLLGFTAQMIYPLVAIPGYYGPLSLKRYQGLEGTGFLKKRYPDDAQGVAWLKKNLSGQPVVLEAAGDSYTLYNRVSALTGFPTIEGWLVHEWLWRRGFDQPGQRAAEVEKIYQGESDEEAERLLKKYQVEYVFVGELEREKYPRLKEERFSDWGKLVFSSGRTKIYQLEWE